MSFFPNLEGEPIMAEKKYHQKKNLQVFAVDFISLTYQVLNSNEKFVGFRLL